VRAEPVGVGTAGLPQVINRVVAARRSLDPLRRHTSSLGTLSAAVWRDVVFVDPHPACGVECRDWRVAGRWLPVQPAARADVEGAAPSTAVCVDTAGYNL